MHLIQTYFLLFLGGISKMLNIRQRNKFGRFLGNMMMLAGKKRREITSENVKNAFPGKSDEERDKIVRGSYQNLGITLAELLAFPSYNEEDFRKYIRYENIGLINEVHSRGNGVMLLSGHFGNWELLAYSAGLFSGIPATIIVKPQKNKHADTLLNNYRTRGGNSIIPVRNSARKVVSQLTSGGAIALLADQSASEDKDLFIDFFGRPATTYEAPAALALKFNTPIIAGFAERQPDCTYRVKLTEIKHDDLEYNKEGIRELTERHVRLLEEEIRKLPDHWAWQHRRWKHTPGGKNG